MRILPCNHPARSWLALVAATALITMAFAACEGTTETDQPEPTDELERPDGWTEQTHGKDTPPDYDLLFAEGVHRLDIVMAPEIFQDMQDDLANIVAGSGGGTTQSPEVPPEAIEACVGLQEGDPCEINMMGQTISGTCLSMGADLACVPEGSGPGAGGAGGMSSRGPGNMLTQDPVYVEVEVHHEGHVWTHVGMRYKGNSSLASSFEQGIAKLPFRLHFDKFEDQYPEIHDQRFYGFKKLTFSSNWSDDSQLREFVAAEIFRDRGVAAPRCAFYRIFVDVGAGAEYWGLYTMIEDPADGAMLDSQFSGRGGNLYKPEPPGADWTEFDPEGFVKKTNEDEADWSDVQDAMAALHADQDDAEQWRQRLEETFDADRFLRWLAVNTVIVNWDTYGTAPHNYYLYGDPAAAGQLKWIPWDNNMALMLIRMGEDDATREIFHTDVGTDWPLISRLLADETYAATYRGYLDHALAGAFAEEAAADRLRELHDRISPYVVGPDGEQPPHTTISSEQAFVDSVDGADGLIAFIQGRHARVAEAFASSP